MSSDPTTAVILIGDGIFFKPGSDALSVTITKREELSNCLDSKAEKSSIGAMHLIIQAASVSTLFDPDAIHSFAPLFRSDGEMYVHILGNPGI